MSLMSTTVDAQLESVALYSDLFRDRQYIGDVVEVLSTATERPASAPADSNLYSPPRHHLEAYRTSCTRRFVWL